MTNDIKFSNGINVELIKIYKCDMSYSGIKAKYISTFIYDDEIIVARISHCLNDIKVIDYVLTYDHNLEEVDNIILDEFNRVFDDNIEYELIDINLLKIEILNIAMTHIVDTDSDIKYITQYTFSDINDEIDINFKFYLKYIDNANCNIVLFERTESELTSNNVIIALYGGEFVNSINTTHEDYDEILRKD